MIKILFANVKGGVAKTTDVAMVAADLKRKGNRVLLIDSDPQGGLTECAGFVPLPKDEDPNGIESQLMDVFDGKKNIKEAIVHTEMGDLVPNSFYFFVADKKYVGPASYLLLKNALKEVENDYDYCLIDSLPGAGIIMYNCLAASDYVIIPILAAKSSVRGISFLQNCIEDVQSTLNPNLKILGFIVNRFNKMTKFGIKIVGEINDLVTSCFGCSVFETKIRNGVAIDECEYEGKSIYLHKPESNVAKDFEALTNEIVERIKGFN